MSSAKSGALIMNNCRWLCGNFFLCEWKSRKIGCCMELAVCLILRDTPVGLGGDALEDKRVFIEFSRKLFRSGSVSTS